jgi:glycosyltransferase involved in cell wall biosynthesis
VSLARCDLHVHSRFSTDSGNYALRRARLGESYTEPRRVYDVCLRRGMRFVTITDHNTVEGALRIADLPGAFLSVEVTTRFPEDDVPLHVLVWGLTEEDHRDLQPYRPSVYELRDFLAERGLAHALAHPLYRMGPPITSWHVERLLLLFGVWEGRNGGRPREHNEAACRIAALATPARLAALGERHDLEPRHRGPIALVGGSDDHGAVDIATTWTVAAGSTPADFLANAVAGGAAPDGEHGSAEKLAHAVLALFVNAYRSGSGKVPEAFEPLVADLFDTDADDAAERHGEITATASTLVAMLGERARAGGLGFDAVAGMGPRLARLALAAALQAPFLGTARHHADARRDLAAIEASFFGDPDRPPRPRQPRALVFTDTFEETNGVAGTMRRLAAEDAGDVVVVAAGDPGKATEGVLTIEPEWSLPLPTSEHIELRFPSLLDVLRRVEAERPDVVHVATPGPVGLSGLAVAKLLGLPLVGSYHTELGPYALHLTRDLVVAEAMGAYVDWFYGRCDVVLAPTAAVAADLARRNVTARIEVWSRGVDTAVFSPARRRRRVREELLGDGTFLLLSVGRLSPEKRLETLLASFELVLAEEPGARLAIVGDGPAREELERRSPPQVRLAGELRGADLAAAYASADVFCFPSTTDTFGQVLLEAGASGLPVVAAAAGGALDLVEPGATGLLVPPDDPAAFAAAVVRLARDPALRADLVRRGSAAASRRTWSRSFSELRAAYRLVGELDELPLFRPRAA